MTAQSLPRHVWCVRADGGTYTKAFVQNGYAAIGWLEEDDLSSVATREQIASLYRSRYPSDSDIVAGQQVGQISRFVLEAEAGDLIIAPDANTELLQYGYVAGNYFY